MYEQSIHSLYFQERVQLRHADQSSKVTALHDAKCTYSTGDDLPAGKTLF